MKGYKHNKKFVVELTQSELYMITSALDLYVNEHATELEEEEDDRPPEVEKILREAVQNGTALYDALENLI